MNLPPVSPSKMCIPDDTNIESTSSDSIQDSIDQETAIERKSDADDTANTCFDDPKVKLPAVAQTTVDEVESTLASQGQETVATNEEYVTADSTNISKCTNEVGESRMPEYMNLAVNMGHDAAKILGIKKPKKLPAPPVPPRNATSNVE